MKRTMEIKQYRCDMCDKVYPDREDVSGSVTITPVNGEGQTFADVCNACVQSIDLHISDELMKPA
jgi:hypothetical protein